MARGSKFILLAVIGVGAAYLLLRSRSAVPAAPIAPYNPFPRPLALPAPAPAQPQPQKRVIRFSWMPGTPPARQIGIADTFGLQTNGAASGNLLNFYRVTDLDPVSLRNLLAAYPEIQNLTVT